MSKTRTEHRLRLRVLDDRLAVCRLPPGAPVELGDGVSLLSLTITPDEVSVVVPDGKAPPGARVEGGWRCLQVVGPLDFTLCGVLASLATPLAAAGVSIFAISTFDTDYLLVKDEQLHRAVGALTAAGHEVTGGIHDG